MKSTFSNLILTRLILLEVRKGQNEKQEKCDKRNNRRRNERREDEEMNWAEVNKDK